jgi:hypothetical protein
VADIDRSYSDSVGLGGSAAVAFAPTFQDALGLTDYTLPGDTFDSPLVISGVSSSTTFSTLGAKREAGEPDDTASAGDGTGGTVWFEYTPTLPGELTVDTAATTSNTDTVIEVYSGSALADLVLEGFGDDIGGGNLRATVTVTVGADVPYYIRVHNKTSAITPISNNVLTWDLVERTAEYAAVVQGDLAEAPGIVLVNLTQGVPGESIDANLVGYGSNPLDTDVLDDEGNITNWSILIPAGTTVGTHTLEFVGASTTTADFEVLAAAPVPTDPAGTPTAPSATATVRWILEDVGPGGVTYTVPNNPARMSSPHPPRNLTTGHTTSPEGQALVWEGATRPYPWEFEGYCGTEDFYNHLKLFCDIGRRFYLHDHRGRTWIVSFDVFDAKPRRDINNPWAHDYTMRATIFGGPL